MNINENRIKLKQLNGWIARFEESKDYAQYKMYIGLSSKDKDELWKEWEVYYTLVKQSKIGRLMQKQREAFMINDYGKVKEITKWLKENMDTIFSDSPHKPVIGDPYEIMYKVSHYVSKKTEQQTLRRIFEDMGEKDENPLL